MIKLLSDDECDILIALAARLKVKQWADWFGINAYNPAWWRCNLCNSNVENVDELIIHAREVHIKNYIIFT